MIYGAAVLVVLAVLAGMAWMIKRSGVTEAQKDQLEDNVDAVRQANEARDSLGDPDNVTELRTRYRR